MPEWTKKRLVIGLAVFFTAVGIWEFRLKPQYRPMYEHGVVLYQHGRYLEALQEFERAYAIAPNAVEVIAMAGWTNLKLRRYEEARFYFQRAQRLEPRNQEAQLGAAFVAWHAGQKLETARIEKLAAKHPEDEDVRQLLRAARAQSRQTR
jgi:tetratricopeptide (TPR) repeat protein